MRASESRGTAMVFGGVRSVSASLTDDGEAREDAGAHDGLEALGDARDVLLRDGAALDGLLELEARLVALERLEAHLER